MNPLKIGLIAQGGPGWAGGSEYTRNLLLALNRLGDDAIATLFCGSPLSEEWKAQDTGSPVVRVPVRKSGSSRLRRYFPQLQNRDFAKATSAGKCDFLYPFTYDNTYNIGVTLPLKGAVGKSRWAGWIPDFQHRFLPHLFAQKEINRRERGIAALLEEAECIVLSSKSAAADFETFFPAHARKAEVLSFATFPQRSWYEPCPEDVSWAPPRYFLVSNQFWKHKNHLVLFEALHLLALRNIRPLVICTGALVDFRDAEYTNTILQAIHKRRLGAQVMLLGLIPRRTQIELMRRALAVVQPSLFEGWSSVVEDCRVLGRPSILSDLPVHLEQNPPGARFFEKESPESLAEALEEAWATLTPGPDLEAEARARSQGEISIETVGRRFLQIAKKACTT